MIYRMEINRTEYDPYSADGEWLDGDRREIREWMPDIREIHADTLAVNGMTPALWAYVEVGDGWEPSSFPLTVENMSEHAWMSQSYSHPYDTHIEETTVRLTDGWTREQRLDVFTRCATAV